MAAVWRPTRYEDAYVATALGTPPELACRPSGRRR